MGGGARDCGQNMNLGICMAGLESGFERALDRAKAGETFVYCEIGVAHCETFQSVCKLLDERKALWRAIAIDPWVPAFEAYQKKIAPDFGPDKALLLVQTREDAFATEKERIGDRLDFVFIDGCHTKKCVVGDFLSVEPLVVPAGIVVFHDFDDIDKGWQQHCSVSGTGVLPAVKELGLFDDTRPGWKRLPDWIADASKNGFNCGVFEKL